MQTALLKYEIISWITESDDKKIIKQLHQWIEKQESQKVSTSQTGSLTKGFGIWTDDLPFDEKNYRDYIWQTGKNAW